MKTKERNTNEHKGEGKKKSHGIENSVLETLLTNEFGYDTYANIRKKLTF
jgi:hypothetical protein